MAAAAAPSLRSPLATSEEGEEEESLLARQIGSMVRPILAYFVLVVGLVSVLDLGPGGAPPFAPLLPGHPRSARDVGPAFANAAVVVALAVLFTYAFAALYSRRTRRVAWPRARSAADAVRRPGERVSGPHRGLLLSALRRGR